MKRVTRFVALCVFATLVGSASFTPSAARADDPFLDYLAFVVGVPSTVLAAGSNGSPAVGALLANGAGVAAETTTFAVPATQAAPLIKAVPGQAVAVVASYALGTMIGGGVMRSFGVDTEEIVCSSSSGLDQLALSLASGNLCVDWNATHPTFVPNQDQYPKFSTGSVCDNSVFPARCVQIVGSKVVVLNGQTINLRCFKHQNYSGWVGMTSPVSATQWRYSASGSLSPVNSGGNALQSGCASFGANYYSTGNATWTSAGFRMAFYQWGGTYFTVKTNTTSSAVTTTYPDPDRLLRCEIQASDGQTYAADSATFQEAGGELPEIVCPALPPGVFILNQSVKEIGGGQTLPLVTQSSTQAYRDWAQNYPQCSSGGCELELFKNGQSCWILDEACDGWVDDPNRNVIYSCEYDGTSAPIQWCFIYGSTFNESNRDSGNAFADPATGQPVPNVRTSPNLEDRLTASLLTRHLITQADWATYAAVQDAPRLARQIAKQCLTWVDLFPSSVSKDDCDDLAIFAPGSDVPTATQHDFDAISGQPAWVQLSYRSDTEQALDGKFRPLYSSATCPDAIPNVTQCDEYPFFTTAQASTNSSFRQIPKEDNAREGNLYQGFLSICGISASPISSPKRNFLVIPLAFSGAPPTSGWCALE